MNGFCLLLTLFLFFENGKWGLINENGAVIQPARYDFIDDPNPVGYSIVKDQLAYGVFDPKGQLAIPLSFDSLFFVSDSILIGRKDSTYQMYRLDGSAIPSSSFHGFSATDECLNLFTQNGKKGLIQNGKFLLPTYDTIIRMNMYCIAIQRNKYSLLTNALVPLSKTVFDSIGIGKNFLKVKSSNKYGMLDIKGNEILPCAYAIVQEVDLSHVIYKETSTSKAKLFDVSAKKVLVTGDFENIIVPSGYDTHRFKPLPEGYFFTLKDDKEGVIHKSGNVILSPIFDQIYYAGWQRFNCQDSSGNHLYSLSGKRLTKHPLGEGVHFDSIPVSPFSFRSLRGAVNIDGEILLPPLYPFIDVDKDRVVYSSGGNNRKSTIKFDAQGKFVERIKNFGTIRIVDTTEFMGRGGGINGRISISRKKGHRFGVGSLGRMEIRDRNGDFHGYTKGALFDSVANRFVGSTFLEVDISAINNHYVAPAITLMGQMALITRSGRFIRTLSFKNDRGKMQASGFNMVGKFCEGLAAVDFENPDFRATAQEHFWGKLLDEKSFAYRHTRGKWGFINSKGKLVIPPQFSTISDFQRGNCIVSINGKGVQVISPSGGFILSKFYQKIERDETNDSLFLIHEPGSPKGLMDSRYKISILPRFMEVKAPSEGIFPAKGKTNKWAFYHLNGKPLTDSIYSNVRSFSNGYAAVSQKGKWGIIDSSGITILSPTYTNISDIHSQRYFAEVKDKVKIFDTKGKAIASKNVEYIKCLNNGTLMVAKGDKKGIINLEGMWIMEPSYESITTLPDGYAIGHIGKKKFLLHPDGTIEACDSDCSPITGQSKQREVLSASVKDFIKTAGRNFPNILFPSDGNLISNGFTTTDHIPFSVKSYMGIVDKNGQIILDPIYSFIKPLGNGMYKVYYQNQIGYYKLYKGWLFKTW